jgi:hypothetical protein
LSEPPYLDNLALLSLVVAVTDPPNTHQLPDTK